LRLDLGAYEEEIFPTYKWSKLHKREDGSFWVLELVNDNTYKLELLGDYNVNIVFTVYNLFYFEVGDDSRLNPCEENESYENQQAIL